MHNFPLATNRFSLSLYNCTDEELPCWVCNQIYKTSCHHIKLFYMNPYIFFKSAAFFFLQGETRDGLVILQNHHQSFVMTLLKLLHLGAGFIDSCHGPRITSEHVLFSFKIVNIFYQKAIYNGVEAYSLVKC
mmetsp:Transcript_8585/g.12601  ORF Transcript_8585/g.12601 Transcript_8585/m.12601 type:complete len:132 (-) Transcript_8585:286-681(-)